MTNENRVKYLEISNSNVVKSENFLLTFLGLQNFVIPVLARQSASARRREDGIPETMKRKYWIPAFAGMTVRFHIAFGFHLTFEI